MSEIKENYKEARKKLKGKIAVNIESQNSKYKDHHKDNIGKNYINTGESNKKKLKQPDRKKKHNKSTVNIFIIIIVVLLIVMTIFILYYPKHIKKLENDFYYNGYHFKKVGFLFSTTTRNSEYPTWYFHFSPKQVDKIPSTGFMSSEFENSRIIYLTFNPSENNLSYTALVAGDLTLGLAKYFNKIVKPACTINTTDCNNVTILTCGEAEKENKTTIFLSQNGPAYVNYRKYCITIQGEQADLVRASEYFMMKYYGIIKE